MSATITKNVKRLQRRLMALICLGAGIVTPTIAAETNIAGTVKVASGTVTAEREGVIRALSAGDLVYAGERIRTDKNSHTAITLQDDTRISTGAKTTLDIKAFEFDTTKQEGNVVLSVLRGITAFVTGALAKSGNDGMKVQTPTATAGIRGTGFVVEVDPGVFSDEE